jgi:hypothetical protein
MTFFMFKNIVSGLLIGDNTLPKDDNVIKGLTNYALTTVAERADSMHLMTLDPLENLVRKAHGDYYVRVPKVPKYEDDDIDIDSELVFAVARLVASYLSKNKGGIHAKEANRIILDFNSKVAALLENIELESIAQVCDISGDPDFPMDDMAVTGASA